MRHPRPPFPARLRWFVTCLAALLLLGCSSGVRLGYDNADLLMRVMANSYFGLTDDQSSQFRVRFARLQDWHRTQELPRYVALFETAGRQLADGLTREEVEAIRVETEARARVLARQAAEEMTPLLATVDEEQIAGLQRKFAEENAKFAKKFVSGEPRKLLDARTERLADTFSWFIDDLTPEQERLVRNFTASQADFYGMRLRERERRQAEFLHLLRDHRGGRGFHARFTAFLVDWEAGYSPEYARGRRAYEQALTTLIVDLDRSSSPVQRKAAMARFRDLAEDFRLLSGERTLVQG